MTRKKSLYKTGGKQVTCIKHNTTGRWVQPIEKEAHKYGTSCVFCSGGALHGYKFTTKKMIIGHVWGGYHFNVERLEELETICNLVDQGGAFVGLCPVCGSSMLTDGKDNDPCGLAGDHAMYEIVDDTTGKVKLTVCFDCANDGSKQARIKSLGG